jgi:hypothetical protein
VGSMGFLILLFLGLPCVLHGAEYIPGHSLKYSEFEAMERVWFPAFLAKKGVLPLEEKWVSSLDKELRPALSELLDNPDTHFFFGSFNDPEERLTGKYRNVDDGAGLRVIGQLMKKTPDGPRFVSFLTFWKYDEKKHALRLLDDIDTLRVRAEIEKEKYVGLSYGVHADEDGKVKRIVPGVYRADNGQVSPARLGHASNPDHCNVCHMVPKPNRDDPKIYDTVPYESFDGLEEFIAHYEDRGVSAGELEAIRKLLADPRKFLKTSGF